MWVNKSALSSSWAAIAGGIGDFEYRTEPASTNSTGPLARASETILDVREMSPSGSLVQPHGPIWPRTSARANTVNVGFGGGGSPEPPPFTSDFEQHAAAASTQIGAARRSMAGHIAR